LSEASERLKKDRQKIVQAFADAIDTPKEKTPPRQPVLLTLICFSLVGTMLPFQPVVTFFSLAAVTSLVLSLLLFWKKQLHFNKATNLSIAGLFLASTLSGCSPAFFTQVTPEMVDIIQQRKYDLHTMQKYSLFGIGLEKINIENAQFEGNIETVYLAKIEHGYGLISLSRITVAGK